jgi:hypothetical protein
VSATAGAAEWQPPPNWGAKSFTKGQSGNPAGASRHAVALRRAIEAKESPDRVLEVIDAMRTCALQGDAKAASVYLKAVGAEVTDSDRIGKAVVALFEAKLAEARERLAIDAEVK